MDIADTRPLITLEWPPAEGSKILLLKEKTCYGEVKGFSESEVIGWSRLGMLTG